jgi:hypothetical protein
MKIESIAALPIVLSVSLFFDENNEQNSLVVFDHKNPNNADVILFKINKNAGDLNPFTNVFNLVINSDGIIQLEVPPSVVTEINPVLGHLSSDEKKFPEQPKNIQWVDENGNIQSL